MSEGLRYMDDRSAITPEDTRYLVRLDELLPAALCGHVDPTDVGSLWYGGVLIWLTVPDVPDGELPVITNRLQVQYTPQTLGAYWGCSHLWDDYDEKNPEHLHLDTSDMTPEAAAEEAAEWVATQLSRPVAVEEWDHRFRSTGRRWVLTDTGATLGRRGRVPRRRPPERTINLR